MGEETVFNAEEKKTVCNMDYDTYKLLKKIEGEVDHLRIVLGIDVNRRPNETVEPANLVENASTNNNLARSILGDILRITEVL